MSHSLRFLCLSMCALSACAPQSEDELVTDQELGEVQSEQSAITQAMPPTTTAPAPLHLRVTWGYLGGDFRAREWINWTGGVKVDHGTASLEHLIFFERHDMAQPSTDPTQVRWQSRTRPHFDGVVLRVQPEAASDVVHLTTPLFSKDFDVRALAAGTEQRFDVDNQGHQLSVSSIPDVGCGGFAFGYERASSEGWLAFAGLLTNERGDNQGVVRFRADAGVITARLIGKDQKLLAQGQGTLNGEQFEFSLGALGTVKGFFQPANGFSPRGSFQASLRCAP